MNELADGQLEYGTTFSVFDGDVSFFLRFLMVDRAIISFC